jgi:hypothetical protein
MNKFKLSLISKLIILSSLLSATFFVGYIKGIESVECEDKTFFITEPKSKSIDTDKLLKIISDWRVSQSLKPIAKNELLCDSAAVRAVEVQTDWSHDKLSVDKICRSVYCSLGENLSRYFSSEQEILDSWLGSPGHLEVLSNPTYRHGCIVQVGDYTVLHLSDVNLKY